MAYDKQHFIRLLSAIPEDRWAIGSYKDDMGRCCALGHCGFDADVEGYEIHSEEGNAFCRLFGPRLGVIPEINDGEDPRYQQSTPKARILAALNDLP